jgi:hypothetical protein
MIICFKTRAIITHVQKEKTTLDLLNERFKDSPLMLKSLVAGQKQKLPYHGHCVHLPYKSRLKMPVPNFNFKGLKVLGDWILTSNKPDPFMGMDRKYKITLSVLDRAEVIYTRSDVVACDDYVEKLNKNVRVNLVFNPELNADQFRQNFPGCPSQLRLFVAYRKLIDLGFNVRCIDQNKNQLFIKRNDADLVILKSA